jgi:hypothetical protein
VADGCIREGRSLRDFGDRLRLVSDDLIVVRPFPIGLTTGPAEVVRFENLPI